MAAPYSIKRQVILIKKETTYGTDPTPTASANGALVINPVLTPRSSLIERQTVSATLGRDPSLVGSLFAELAFSVELRGSGSAGTALKGIGAALQACAMVETVTGGVSVGYKPTTDPLASVTIYHYLGERLHKLTGAVGDVELVLEAGRLGLLNFTFRGIYSAPTGGQTIPSPTYDTPLPPVVKSASFAYNSIALTIQQLQIRLQNVIAQRDDVNAANSIKGFQVTDRDVIGSFNPEQEAIATYDPYADWSAGTSRALTVTVGSSAGNRCVITAPKAMLREVNQAERNSLLIYNHAVGFGRNAGDDEIELLFN